MWSGLKPLKNVLCVKANHRMKVGENYIRFPVVHENSLVLKFEYTLWSVYKIFLCSEYAISKQSCQIETVQDFLIKLGVKPLMHLLEISIFSLNIDLGRLTKIMNNVVKDLKILSFKVIFQYLKLFLNPNNFF